MTTSRSFLLPTPFKYIKKKKKASNFFHLPNPEKKQQIHKSI